MTNRKRIISLLLAAVLLVNASASALAENPHVMTQTELEAAWALTGLDENAAQYREGMAFSEHMNAQQLKCWLDELLDEELAGIKHLYSELENTLYEIEQENSLLYKSMTEGSSAANYQHMQDTYDEMENLRQRIRYLRDQLDIKNSVIGSRMEIITDEAASDSAKLIASRQIEEAAADIKKIRAELAENAEDWVARIANLHASMTVSGAANGLRSSGGDQAEWVDSILAYKTAEPVSVQVSSSVLYPSKGLSLTARLLPVSSALADDSSKIKVDVMDANSIALTFVDAADNQTPLANVKVTLDTGGLKETVTTNERGNAVFSADKHNPNGDGEVTGSVDVNAEGYRGFYVTSTTFKKGEKRNYALVKDNGDVYIRGASFQNDITYYHDILMDTYTAFHSTLNDQEFDLVIRTSRKCTVTLTYIGLDKKPKELKADTDSAGYIRFSEQWKNMVMPGVESPITVSLTEGTTAGETRTLGLSFVKGVLDQPITSVTDIMSVFKDTGFSLNLPSDLFAPLGGMSFSANIPFVKWLDSVKAVGNVDGTFLIYIGKIFQPENIGRLQTSWKSMDQKDLDTEVKNAEKWSFKDQLEKTEKGITDLFNKDRPTKFPILGSAQLSFCFGAAFMGKFVKADKEYKNWQYSFKAIVAIMASLDANFKVVFMPTPPVFLNISVQASLMFAPQFAFMAEMKDGVATGMDVDWGAFGFSLTFRLSFSIGISFGLPGVLSFTVGGFVWIQLFLSVAKDAPTQFKITFGGGAFLEIKIWFFTYRWNIYDSGERVIYPKKKTSSNALPWYDSLLPQAQAEEKENGDGENGAVSLLPDDYSALVPSAKLEMENFSLCDSNVKFITAGGIPYMFYIAPGDGSLSRSKVVCRNMKTGETETLLSDKYADYFTFDVEVQHPSKQYVSLGYDPSKDIVIIAVASAREFEKKEITDANGQKQTISVPKNAELTYMGRYFSSTGAGGFVGLPLGTFTLDRPLNNLQLSFWQGMNLATPTFYVQFLMDDLFGDKSEKEYVIVLYDAYSTKDIMHPHRRGQRVIQDPESIPGVFYQQIMGADITPGYQRGENPSTLYLLQDGTLLRRDYYIGSGSQETARGVTISNTNVSFFMVFDDTANPYHPHVFYLEDEEVTAKGEAPSLIHHLKAAKLSFQEDVGKADWAYLDTVDLDVTIPGGDFQVQQISDTIYLYWLETAPKDKAGDPDVYRLRCVVYDPDTMVATDDFVLAEFTAEPGTRPANLYLAENGTGYYVRWNADGSASVYSFPHKLVPHADLKGVTSSVNMVRTGADVDFYLSVMNDGNTNLATLDLEMVVQDDQGNVIKGRSGNEVRERFHLNLLDPELSSRTVYGDSVKTDTGDHFIYRTDDLAEPIQKSSFNVSRKTYSIDFEHYKKSEASSTVTSVTSKHILPGETISLTLSVHIPTDLKAGSSANIVIRLANRQANALTGYGEDEVVVDRSEHDLDVGHRVYLTPDGEERLAVTISDHANSGEPIRLYAELYLDNSPDPIYVDLPYYPELVSADMTHNLDIPVAALLNGQQAQKVEMRILAAGVKEDMVRNNAFTFYVMNYTSPLRILYQPVDTSVLPDGEAVFSVAATGGLSPYEYQWQEYLGADLGWKDIAGAEESTLTVPNVKLSMNGRQYRCVVKDHNNAEINSDPATLNVVSTLPPTGDHTNLYLYLTLAAAALILAAALRYAKKKREQRQE